MSIQRARAALPVLFGGGASYTSKVLGYSPIAYWPLTETSGTTADNAEGTAARDGTYSGVTLNNAAGPAGGRVGRWDGVNDYCNIYSASLNTAFDPAEVTLTAWVRVAASSVWTDDNGRLAVVIQVNADNRIQIAKKATNNTVFCRYTAGAAEKDIEITTSDTGWLHFAITASVTADEVRAYINGSQSGSTLTGLGTWSLALSSTGCIIGAFNTSALAPWNGYLAHVAVFSSALTPSEVADLATV